MNQRNIDALVRARILNKIRARERIVPGHPRWHAVAATASLFPLHRGCRKLKVMMKLSILNSRMKGHFDLWVMAYHSDFDGIVLAQVIRTTFKRRCMDIPLSLPFGPADKFAQHGHKNMLCTGSAQEHLEVNATDHGDRGVT